MCTALNMQFILNPETQEHKSANPKWMTQEREHDCWILA